MRIPLQLSQSKQQEVKWEVHTTELVITESEPERSSPELSNLVLSGTQAARAEGSEFHWYRTHQGIQYDDMVGPKPQDIVTRQPFKRYLCDSFRRTYGSDSAELYENPVVSPALGSVLPSMLLIFSRSRAREPGDG